MRRPNFTPARGFTLIEVIMTIVLLGIIGTLGVSMMGSSIQAYFAGRDLIDADWRGRSAIERMTRELRGLRSATANDLIATAVQIRFNNVTGNSVCFYLNGTDLMRSADFAAPCGTTNAQILATGVSALNFTYYRDDGVAPTLVANLVRYITVQFTVTQGAASTVYRANVTRRVG